MATISSFYITAISIILVLYVLIGFVKGIKSPLRMACCAILLIPFQMNCPGISALKINELSIILWIILFCFHAVEQRTIYVNKQTKLIITYLFLMLICSLINYLIVVNSETLIEYFRLFITVIFPLTITMLFGTQLCKQVDDIFIAWNKGATLVSLASLLYIPLVGHSYLEYFREYFVTKTQYFYELKFASSPCIADPNSYAGYLAISLIITFYLLLHNHKKRYLLSLIVELLGLVTSLSRGVIFAVIVVAVIYVLINKKSRWLGIILVPLGIVVTVVYFIPYVMGDGSATSRFGLWATALNMYKQSPIFGVGLQNYTYMFSSFRSSLVTIDTPFTHNLYLKVLVETGAIGEIYFLYLCISAIIRGIRLRSVDKACFVFALGILTFMIQGLSVEFFTSYFFWFVLVVGGIYTLMRQQIQDDSNLESIL